MSGAELDPSTVRADALVLPLDYASSVGPALAAESVLAADDVTQFQAVRRQRTLGDYPAPTHWTGDLLRGVRTPGRPDARTPGRIVCQNLGNGLSDLVVADVVAREARTRGVGQLLGGQKS